MEKVHS